jgi:hypothetical protein
MVLNLPKETDERFQPEYVSFAHCPEDVSEVQRILRCEVRAGAPWSGLAVTNEAWHMPFRRSDPVLRRVLQQQADEIIARLPAANGVAIEVRRALAKQMAGGRTRIDSIARDLATTTAAAGGRGNLLSGSRGVDTHGGGRKVSGGLVFVDLRSGLLARLLGTKRLPPCI